MNTRELKMITVYHYHENTFAYYDIPKLLLKYISDEKLKENITIIGNKIITKL